MVREPARLLTHLDEEPAEANRDTDGTTTVGCLHACAEGPTEGTWPVDMDRDGDSHIGDVLRCAPLLMSEFGDPEYDRRFDLNADGKVNAGDVINFGPYILTSCL